MDIIRQLVETGLSQIPNAILFDSRLSFKARGLMAYLFTNPNGASAEKLAAESPDGRDSVRAGLRELAKLGYVEHRRTQGPDGRWSSELVIHREPGGNGPGTENPSPVPPAQTHDLSDTGPPPSPAGPAPPDTAPTENGKPVPGATSTDTVFALVRPETGNPSPVRPAQTPVSAGRTGDGKPVPGPTCAKTLFPQVAPKTGFPALIDPPNHAPAALAEVDLSDETRRSINQSAGTRQAHRWLITRYRLTEHECEQVLREVRARAPKVIRRPVAYLEGMQEGDLADIVTAVLDRSPPSQLPLLAAVPTSAPAAPHDWCGECDQFTRLTNDDPDRPGRCPRCHPMRPAIGQTG